MKKKKKWYEDNQFWLKMKPFLFPQERWDHVPAEIDSIISKTGISPKAKILDLCCGVGRHSLEFARRGYRVTGVDRTEIYLRDAKKKAKKEKLDIEFVHSDMRRYCKSNQYDLVINLFTSFGYFDNPKEDRKVLKNIYRSLKKEGILVMDVMGKEKLARIFLEKSWDELNGVYHLAERKITRDWSWCENRWILINGKKRYEFKVTHRLYSALELRQLLKETGFGKIEIYGDFTGSPYDQNAKRLIAFAWK